MGVSDYLVYPVPFDTLSEVIASTLIEKLGASGSRLIAVVGAKGGVGATAIAEAMGWISAEFFGQKTLLLDAAGAWSSMGVGLGYEPIASTSEAIKAAIAKDQDSLKRMYYQASDKLFALATGAESMLESAPQLAQFEDVLNAALSNYPVVIADLSGAAPAVKKSVLTRAHQIVVVSTAALSSLRSARALIQEIKKIQSGKSIEFFINMAGIAPGKEVPKGDIKSAMDCDPSLLIPFMPKSFIGVESEGKKLSDDKDGYDIMQMMSPFMAKAIGKGASSGQKSAESGLGQSLLSKFKIKK
jgi:pilus assembly protein CpaE